VIPRERLASARIPGGGEMILYRRGRDHMILVDRDELMSSRMSGSEEALALMTAQRLGNRPSQRWLVGGYGMGFTLRAALGVLPRDAHVTVAELVPEIVDWAKGPMAAMTGDSLADPRAKIRIADVAHAIADGGPWDAVLLDVDNGPDGLVRAANDRLYSVTGLAAARAALKPGGILAIWSAAPDPKFAKRLAAARLRVEETPPRHVIWFATPA
jgi:spermidine synthase